MPVEEEGIGIWLLAPWAMGAVLILAIALLPKEECGAGARGLGHHIPYAVVTGLAVFSLLGGAAYRLWRLWQARRLRPVGAAIVVAVVAATVVIYRGGVDVSALGGWIAFAAGIVAAIACYLLLVGAFAAGKRAVEAGVLLPITLFLVVAFIGGPFAGVVLGLNEGAIC
jgi:hypothetical protein